MQKVLVIVGPTASGKSSLAVDLALKFDGEIVSADSRQVYKGLDLGTGKITKEEMQGVPHYLLDVADPTQIFSAAEYKSLAMERLHDIEVRKKLPIIVGGTGFYIDSITGKVSLPDVAPNKKLREKLESKPAGELYEILKSKDPERASAIDPHNKVRIIRSLEIIESLGKVPTCRPARSTNYEFIFIGLNPDQKTLDSKIRKRLIDRINQGMIDEASKLYKEGLSYQRMESLGLEYKYLALYLQNKMTKEEMINKLYTEIRRYAKRQMTWFKRNEEISWFNPKNKKEIEKYIGGKLS